MSTQYYDSIKPDNMFSESLAKVVECEPIEDLLVKDIHDVPYSEIGKRSGALKNVDNVETETTALMRKVVGQYGCHKVIINSFDHLLLHRVPRKILGTIIIVNNIRITFNNIKLMKPFYSEYSGKSILTPRLARFKKLSYNVKIYADIMHHKRNDGKLVLKEEFVEIGEIPAMLGSVGCHLYGRTDGEKQQLGECPNDTLGYFLNNGSEKVFKNKETIRYNLPMTYYIKDMYETRFTCFSNSTTGTTLFLLKVHDNKKDLTNIFIAKLQHFKVETEQNRNACNVFLLFRYLGWSNERAMEVIEKLTPGGDANKLKVRKILQDTITHSNMTEDDRLSDFFRNIDKEEEVKTFDEESIRDRVLGNLFSNTEEREKKLYMLAYVTCHTAMVKLKIIQEDNRNSWSNKKLMTAAGIIEGQFSQIWASTISDAEDAMNGAAEEYIVNSKPMADKFFPKSYMKKKISEVFSTKVKFLSGKETKPLSEQFKKTTPIDGTSQITKTFAQTSTRDKKNEVRTVNMTQIMVACPAETPENAQIGSIKNLAIGCWLSMNNLGPSRQEVEKYAGKVSDTLSDTADVPLFVNGELLGFTKKESHARLRRMKHDGVVPFDACIHYNPTQNCIELLTMDTRTCIPFLIVRDGILVIDDKKMWGAEVKDLLREGCIEWLDAREAEYAKVAESPMVVRRESRQDRYTHCCIQANMMFGWAASISPWSNRNKGPRVVYQASMSKQSLCAFSSVHSVVYDPFYKVLNWATRPVCESNTNRLLGLETMPTSQNIIVAILARPDNNEDAVEMKKESLEKQLFRISKYTTINVTVENRGLVRETLARPAGKNNTARFAHIDNDGLPRIGSYIKRGDCIVSKLKSASSDAISYNAKEDKYETSLGDPLEDSSKYAGIDEDGYVESVLMMENATETLIRVKIHQFRKYEPGDKVALRYSQKGTVGRVVRECDMPRILGGPFDGVSPDEMMSPLSGPTRMTAALQVELLSGLLSILTGERIDSTTFEEYDINQISVKIRKIGEERYGLSGEDLEDFSKGIFKMTRHDGKIMGETILNADGSETFVPTKVFMGPMAVQALRHHVVDKFQVRRKGSTNALTRQGVSGRSRHGALRFGEMENDAVKSAGAADILLERLRTVADEFKLFICSCGAEAIAKPQEGTIVCSSNKNHGRLGDSHSFGVAKVTYISILIKRLLAVAGIDFKMIPKA